MSTLLEPSPARSLERAPAVAAPAPRPRTAEPLVVYLLLGVLFGIALMKSEAVSWFRIQEMMRMRNIHLFAVFGSAVVTTALGLRLIARHRPRTVRGAAIVLPPKVWGSGIRYVVGGTLFGAGWAITGTCPGPLYALLGAGVGPVVIPLVGALAGAWTYGWLRPRLPH